MWFILLQPGLILAEIAKALQFNGRQDYYFALKQEYKTYQHLQQQIIETDIEVKKLLEDIIDKDDNKKQHVASKKKSHNCYTWLIEQYISSHQSPPTTRLDKHLKINSIKTYLANIL